MPKQTGTRDGIDWTRVIDPKPGGYRDKLAAEVREASLVPGGIEEASRRNLDRRSSRYGRWERECYETIGGEWIDPERALNVISRMGGIPSVAGTLASIRSLNVTTGTATPAELAELFSAPDEEEEEEVGRFDPVATLRYLDTTLLRGLRFAIEDSEWVRVANVASEIAHTARALHEHYQTRATGAAA